MGLGSIWKEDKDQLSKDPDKLFVDPARSTCRRDSLLIEKVSCFSSFRKFVPSEERFYLESPLTFYFYFIKGKIQVRTKEKKKP